MTDVIKHVACGGNENYVAHTAAMLHSLSVSNNAEEFHIHFLHDCALRRSSLAALESLCLRLGFGFTNVEVDRGLLDGVPAGQRYTIEAWYRIVLPDLMPQQKKILWLDSDMLILDSIQELWDTPLDGCAIAAVRNALMPTNFFHTINLGITSREHYFSTGVLLIDALKFRKVSAGKALRDAAITYADVTQYPDQDAFNVVFSCNYKRLELRWNVVTNTYFNTAECTRVHGKEEYKQALTNPGIVHFTDVKPSEYRCMHPYRSHYLHHLRAAGWPEPPYTDKNLRTWVLRLLPIRVRVLLSQLRSGRYRNILGQMY